jgi:hypothetical protein
MFTQVIDSVSRVGRQTIGVVGLLLLGLTAMISAVIGLLGIVTAGVYFVILFPLALFFGLGFLMALWGLD